MRIFIDQTAWVSLIDPQSPYHQKIGAEFQRFLVGGDKIFTHNIAIGLALSDINQRLGSQTAGKFSEIIEEAHTGTHLTILWIGRRTQKEAMRMMRRYLHLQLDLYDYAAYIVMNRRRIRTILTIKSAYNSLDLKVIPEMGE